MPPSPAPDFRSADGNRRGFEFLVVELSLALDRLVPRYPLWLYLQELGWNPLALTKPQLQCFVDEHLHDFLAGRGLELAPRRARRLSRAFRRFDPRHPTPYETMERLLTGGAPRR